MPKCSAACGTAGVCNILGWGGMGAAIVLPWWVADGDGEIDTGLWQDCDFFPDCDDKFSFQDILKGPVCLAIAGLVYYSQVTKKLELGVGYSQYAAGVATVNFFGAALASGCDRWRGEAGTV